MICSPRHSDPPFPVRITSCKRSDGEYKGGISRLAEDHYLNANQEVYRFELSSLSPSLSRSASVPPEPPCQLQGATWTDWYSDQGGGGIRCFPQVYDSSEMEGTTNQDGASRQAALEREVRLASDSKFADLCAITGDLALRSTQEVGSLLERTHAGTSSGMASSLAWST